MGFPEFGLKVYASLLLVEYLQITLKREPFLVVMQEIRNLCGSGTVGAHKLLLFVCSRYAKDKRRLHAIDIPLSSLWFIRLRGCVTANTLL